MYYLIILRSNKKLPWKKGIKQEYSGNANTSTSGTFDIVPWTWPMAKVMNIGEYLGTRHKICELNSSQDMTKCKIPWHFYFTCDFERQPRSQY